MRLYISQGVGSMSSSYDLAKTCQPIEDVVVQALVQGKIRGSKAEQQQPSLIYW